MAAATLPGVVSGDAVAATLGGTFTSKNTGNADKTNITGQALTGASATNHVPGNNVVGFSTAANITPKSLTLTGLSASNKVYDATTVASATGTLSAVISGVSNNGFAGGETASALSGTVTCGGSSQGATARGTCGIVASGLNAPNYSISFVRAAGDYQLNAGF
jgi:hypothetical protein